MGVLQYQHENVLVPHEWMKNDGWMSWNEHVNGMVLDLEK